MYKKLIALVLAAFMLAAVFAGCGAGTGNGAGSNSAASNIDTSKTVVNADMGPEPDTIDPAMNTAADSANYIIHAFEGLTRVDKDGKTVPGIAEKWDVSKDGLTYTFHLRDSKWSDGKALTAKDFEYSWKRALDPKTASQYASQLYFIKNGEAFNSDKAKADDVGVKATDDKTLVVTLESPTGFFLDLCNFPTYMPVRQDIIEKYGEKWIQTPESYIGNGPYKMTAWSHNSEIVMKANENYWDKNWKPAVKEIHFKMNDDPTTGLNAFESGEYDFNDAVIPPAELPKLIADKKTTPVDEIGVNYVIFNVKKPPLDNKKVRQALSLAIDRKFIVEKVMQGGQKTSNGFVPYGTPGVEPGKDFRSEDSTKYNSETADIEGAKKLLAEAGFPDGQGIPELEYVTNPGAANAQLAEALQSMWAKIGIKVKVNTMEWKVLLPYRDVDKKHQIARGAWVGDYMDPYTFMHIQMTTDGNNSTNWSNAEYDKLCKDAMSTADPKARMEAMHKAEKILMDELPIIPTSYRLKQTLIQPKLKGIYQNGLGFVYFQNAYWEK